jgi:dipeptidyl aminopeptidase/acylaminoacyl peptidase
MNFLFVLMVAIGAGLAGCATRPTHPTLREARLPPLISAHSSVADPTYSGEHRISPDGSRLLWVEWVDGDWGLAVRAIGSEKKVRFKTGALASLSAAPIQFAWLGDSRHIAWTHDETGDENTRILVVDTSEPDRGPRDLTPWPGTRSILVATGGPVAPALHVQSNRRDRALFDLLRINYVTGEVNEVARNPGDVSWWIVDVGDGQPGGRLRQTSDAKMFEVYDRAFDLWREVKRWDPLSMSWVRALNRTRGFAVLVSDSGRDTTALVWFDLNTGHERQIFADDRVDISRVFFAFGNVNRTVAVEIDRGIPETRLLRPEEARRFDEALRNHFGAAPLGFLFLSADRAFTRIVVKAYSDRATHELLFDRGTVSFSTLRSSSSADADHFARSAPVDITARDGRRIPAFITRPSGVSSGVVPLVVGIHGGPWARSYWSMPEIPPTAPLSQYSSSLEQFYASRGYAVVTMNYRASTGYGHAHTMGGVREVARKAQDDIEDVVRWAVSTGIADPKRIAINGGSIGGFSTYWQLIRSPDFACGISVVGVADLIRFLAQRPPYWTPFPHRSDVFYGRPDVPSERQRLEDESPLTHVHRIKVPMLIIHGANDVRVSKQDSDDMVSALRRQGTEVEYLWFEDEGHAIRKWRNRLSVRRATEQFLARCLGGRAGQ